MDEDPFALFDQPHPPTDPLRIALRTLALAIGVAGLSLVAWAAAVLWAAPMSSAAFGVDAYAGGAVLAGVCVAWLAAWVRLLRFHARPGRGALLDFLWAQVTVGLVGMVGLVTFALVLTAHAP